MTIEILFGEACNLHGDGQNVTYLQASLPDAEFIFTPLTEEPYFVQNKPDMIYLGSMSESIQRRVIEKLMPHRARLLELVEDGIVFLATGNAGDIFCKKIEYITEAICVEGLDFFDNVAKVNWFDRYNGKILGKFEDIEIIGFKSQFSMIEGDNSSHYFFEAQRGIGINPSTNLEGLKKNNLICTQVLGPMLTSNPLFTQYLMGLLGESKQPAYFEAAKDAYDQRLSEFKDPKVYF